MGENRDALMPPCGVGAFSPCGGGLCWRDFISTDSFSSQIRKLERAHLAQGDNFSTLCNVSLTRLHFLYSCKENEAKESTPGLRPWPPVDGTAAAFYIHTRWNPFGETPENSPPRGAQTIRALVLAARHAKQRMASGQNSLTSHAVRFCGRCLGLQRAGVGAVHFQISFSLWNHIFARRRLLRSREALSATLVLTLYFRLRKR